jgi:cytoskeleton protein RodZ
MRQLSYDDPKSDMGSFGNKFRKAREGKKLSLDDVSNVTKISSRMLKAIEDENFDQLPGGVFNKGFVRAYAKQVGINEEDAVADYLACRQEQIDSYEGGSSERRTGTDRRKSAASNSTAAKNATQTQSPVDAEEELPGLHLPRSEDIRHKPKEYLNRESAGIPWLTIAVILVIVLAVALIWIRYSRHTRTESKPLTPAVSTSALVGAPKTASSQSVSQLPTPASTSNETLPHPKTPKSPNATPTAASIRSTSPAAPQSSSNAAQADTATTDTENTRSAAPPPAKSQSALNLIIRAAENSWISVTADGQSVTHETLIAPAHTTVRANREIVVKVGNAAGVTFSWKGQEIPAQGVESEVKTIVFDAEGMHASIPQSSEPQN